MRIEDEKICFLFFCPCGGDVLALLPDKESVQLKYSRTMISLTAAMRKIRNPKQI